MFDISIGKLALLACVGLVVLGPERLPKVAFVLGRFWRNSQRYINQIKQEMNTLSNAANLKQPLNELGDEIRKIDNHLNHYATSSTLQDIHITDASFTAPLLVCKKRLGRQSWRIKSQAIPKWYKLSQGKALQLQGGAARMRRYRPGFRLN